VIGSPYYWAFVASITLLFAAIDLEALRSRSFSRFHGLAVALYVGAWGVVSLSLPVTPVGAMWWLFPAAVRIAFSVMFAGGQLLAELVREEQALAHPERRPPAVPVRKVSEDELRAGELYDDQWQIEDRERNRMRELHAREERERKRRRRLGREGEPRRRSGG